MVKMESNATPQLKYHVRNSRILMNAFLNVYVIKIKNMSPLNAIIIIIDLFIFNGPELTKTNY